MDNFERIQTEHALWAAEHFPNTDPGDTLLGVGEEVGELDRAYLKRKQAIHLDEDHTAKIADAIGDIVIFLIQFCTLEGLNFAVCVNDAWDEVKQRDWNKHREEHNA